MNILFIASYYPPYAPMAGTRIGKTTGYFHRKGHEVRVLGAANPAMTPLLRQGIPEEGIIYVGLDQAQGLLSGAAHRLRRSHDVSDSGEATDGGKAGTDEPRE